MSSQKDPVVRFTELEFILCSEHKTVTPEIRLEAREELESIVRSEGIYVPYRALCERLGEEPDSAIMSAAREMFAKAKQKQKDYEAEAEAHKSALDSAKAAARALNITYKRGDAELYRAALRALEAEGHEGHLPPARRVDLRLAMCRLGFKDRRGDIIETALDQAREILAATADFERKNRLAVYVGLAALRRRDFAAAAAAWVPVIPTFSAYELLDFQQFVRYTVLTGVAALGRAELSRGLVHCSDLMPVLQEEPELNDVINGLYHCRYAQFIRAVGHYALRSLATDTHAAAHAVSLLLTCRVCAYRQYLQAFSTASVANMAEAFKMPPSLVDNELRRLAARNVLNVDIQNGDTIFIGKTSARDALVTDVLASAENALATVTRVRKAVAA